MPSSEVMSKWKHGQLHSGSKKGPVVRSQAQAVAIMLSEKRKEGQHGGKYPHKQAGGPHFGNPGMPPFPGKFGLNQSPSLPQGLPGMAPPFMGGMGAPPGFNAPAGLGMQPGAMSAGMPEGGGSGDGTGGTYGSFTGQMPWMRSLQQFLHGRPGLGSGSFGMRADGGNVIRMPGAATPQQRVFNALTSDDLNKLTTNRTLMNALGGGAKVLSFSPDDKASGGGLGGGYQFGGTPSSMGLTPGWIERQEARNISHTGPIISAVGGRTDHHPISVPSGSYVLPAAHVSAMGQGNTLNGMKILQGIFGAPMKVPHGAGPPRPPAMYRPPRLTAAGGVRSDHTGHPVPIMASGGEYVLSPEQVAKVGGGDINHGHAVLDRWVQNTHKKYAKTIANLPPPAKT